MRRKDTDKRARLVHSAVKLFHLKGFQATSIAEIARDADVPVGNVFYYFRTKDDLIRAVIEHWIEHIDRSLELIVSAAGPRERLEAFLDACEGNAEFYASAGCPLVGLAHDLRLAGTALSPLAGKMAARQADWIEQSYRALGINAVDARRRARALLANLQGSFQLAFTMRDPVIVRVVRCCAQGTFAGVP